MNRFLFISLMLCLVTSGCVIPGLSTDQNTPELTTNNNTTEAQAPTYISDPILGPEHSDFADGSFIAGDLEITIEVPNTDLYEGLTIIYTLDGTDPTKDYGETYTEPVPVLCNAGETITVKAFAFTDHLDSNISSKQYTCNDIKLERPIIVPYQQEHDEDTIVDVDIINTNPQDLKGVKMVYTLDGSTPTTNHGMLYEGPFEITGPANKIIVVKTLAFMDNGTQEFPESSITRQNYVFLPVMPPPPPPAK